MKKMKMIMMVLACLCIQAGWALPIKITVWWYAYQPPERSMPCQNGATICGWLDMASKTPQATIDFSKTMTGTLLFPAELWKTGGELTASGSLVLKQDAILRPEVVKAVLGEDLPVAIPAGVYPARLTDQGMLVTYKLRKL